MISRRALIGAIAALTLVAGGQAVADNSALDADATTALDLLMRTQPEAKDVLESAVGVLVFPEIVKGGFIVGAASGKGVLKVGGKTRDYYRSIAVSYGLQAGIAKFGYVMAFMDESSLGYLDRTEGFELGIGPNVTVADEGFAKKFSTSTKEDGIVVFFVSQDGFFAGAGVEGTKITKLED
ncbi:MAG: lipid-binding SYLF domain-containing protein [Pseudomonadota bacterium]